MRASAITRLPNRLAFPLDDHQAHQGRQRLHYAPVTHLTPRLFEQQWTSIVKQTIKQMRKASVLRTPAPA
jgi:hypothetical protein